MTDDEKALPLAATVRSDEDGVYYIEIAGTLIGKINLAQDTLIGQPERDGMIPDSVRGLSRLRLILRRECKHNALTVFELYISCIGLMWGAYLLLPFATFDGTVRLWLPIRSAFYASRGTYWYDAGAENVVGLTLAGFHICHAIAICRGKSGDHMRCRTICAILSLWSVLALLFLVADPTINNWASTLIICCFLVASLRAVFRGAVR